MVFYFFLQSKCKIGEKIHRLIFVYLHIKELDKATKEIINRGYLHVCVSDGDLWRNRYKKRGKRNGIFSVYGFMYFENYLKV